MAGKSIKLRFFIAVIAVLAIFAAGEWFALEQIGKAFSQLLYADALNAATITIEACRTVYGFQVLREVERETQLFFAAEFAPNTIEKNDLDRIASVGRLPLIVLTDNNGKILEKSSGIPADIYPWINRISDNLPGIYSGLLDSELFGIDRELPLAEGPKGLAMRVNNGILVLFAPEPTIREREELTVGQMIGRLGENPRVRYIALQDEGGFVFATKSVRMMSSLAADTFLAGVSRLGQSRWRYTDFSSERVFELAVPFPSMGTFRGVLRVGLSTKDYDRLFTSYAVQIGIILALVLAASVAASGFILATKKLAVQKGLSDAILSEMKAACVAIDAEGKITLINPVAAKIFHLRQTTIGENIFTAMPGDPLNLMKANEGKSSTFRIENYAKKNIVLDVSNARLPNGGAFAVAEDITSLIELRKEAAGAEHLRALGELAAGVAHEIRNPLNAIGIAAQRLATEFEPSCDAEAYLKLLEGLRAEIARLDGVIREFVGLSAPMAPNLVVQPLEPLLDEVIEAARLRCSGAGIALKTKIGELGEWAIDAGQMKKALFNLLKNAIEATHEGGLVEISASRDENGVYMRIFDNGRPIPKKVMENLGKPFISSGKEGGTGIGLFVAFRVVRDHGGHIEVETEEAGTAFTIVLQGRNK